MKKQSKRTTLKRKYSIESKVREHNRKAKRAAKANPSMRKKLKKDPGIPNLNPFKAQIVARLAEQQKLLKFEATQRARRAQEVAARRRAAGTGGEGAEDGGLAGLAAEAAARGKVFDSAAGAAAAALLADGGPDVAVDPAFAAAARAGNTNRRAFYRQLKALLEKADVLLEVLDARDPMGSRSPALEALALSASPPKRIVLVLNKIDLVPPPVVRGWLAHLRREFPTVAFKASTQHQRDNLSARGGAAINRAVEAGEVLTGSGAAGTDTLLQLLKNYARSGTGGGAGALTVGVVGYPNVGKSSLINSLKRSKAVGVSSTPGSTRVLQEVAVDGKVTVIDCPGIIFDDTAEPASSSSSSSSSSSVGDGLLLRNALSVDAIADPEGAVEGILARCAPEKLMALYAIPAFDDAPQFLGHMALRRGKVSTGGVPDRAAAARSVLQDWTAGRIPFYVLPPGMSTGGAGGDDDEDMGQAPAPTPAPAAGGKKGGKKGAAPSSSSSSSSKPLVTRDLSDVGAASIVAAGSGAGDQPAFDLEGLLAAADEALLGSATSDAGSALAPGVAVSSSSAAKGPRSASAKEAAARMAARLAAAASGEPMSDEEGEEEDEEDDDDLDDDDDDDEMDGEDDDEEDDDEEDDEEEGMEEDDDDAPPPPRPSSKGKGGKAVTFVTTKGSSASGSIVANAAALARKVSGKGSASSAAPDAYELQRTL